MAARIFKRGDIYYAWVPRPEGGTRKVSTQCTDKDAAQARAAQLERESVDPERAAAAKASLRDALELLIRDRASKATAKKGSAATVDFYSRKSGVVLDGVAAVLERSPKAVVFLREVTARVVDEYVMQRREDGAVESTIHKELTTWRAAMRVAKRRGLWFGDIDAVFPKGFSPDYKPRERYLAPEEVEPFYRAIVRPQEVKRHHLTDEQLAALRDRYDLGEDRKALAASFQISTATVWSLCAREAVPAPEIGHEHFALIAYAIATGAEPSALWRARRSDAAPDRSHCLVRGSKNKYRKDRPVPLPLLPFRLLLDFALRHAPGDDVLFPVSMESNFRRTLREACRRAGIAPLTLTDFRRTHGKWLRLSGVAPANIAPSLGHADTRMVERVYGKVSALDLAPVQEAQIAAAGGGLLMGGDTGEGGGLGSPEGTREAVFPSDIRAQRRNRTADTGIFNPRATSPERRQKTPIRAHVWAANGSHSRSEGGSSRKSRPIASAGFAATRVESEDGAVLARTDVTRGESLHDVDERLLLQLRQGAAR